MRTADSVGLEPSEPRVQFARVMERVQEVIRRACVRDTAEQLESEGVEVIRAFGRFARPGVVDAGRARAASWSSQSPSGFERQLAEAATSLLLLLTS